ncbi:MAG: hypothetical protein ABW185_29260, partial [Sedimenticola sp.]
MASGKNTIQFDQDQTFVKQFASPENHASGSTCHDYHHTNVTGQNGSPILDSAGDIQCGQRNPTNGTNADNDDDSLFGSPFGGKTINDIQTELNNAAVFRISGVSYDKLYTDLDGLTKDEYLSKILLLTTSCDETLTRYRSELAERAKLMENGPTGVLISRRNTSNSTLTDKIALDCYQLTQFICGNTEGIQYLFKKSRYAETPIRRNTVSGASLEHSAHVSSLKLEVAELKNVIATMRTDITMLKSETETSKAYVRDITNTMNKDIMLIKSELDACKNAIVQNVTVKEQRDNLATKSLAAGLKHV